MGCGQGRNLKRKLQSKRKKMNIFFNRFLFMAEGIETKSKLNSGLFALEKIERQTMAQQSKMRL